MNLDTDRAVIRALLSESRRRTATAISKLDAGGHLRGVHFAAADASDALETAIIKLDKTIKASP